MRRRVVITGVGVVSPLGLDAPSTWSALLAGKSGIGPITKFDVSAFSCRIGGEVRGFVPENYIEKKEVKPEAHFVDDLGADSLDVVELVMALEEEFKLEISDEDAEKLTTVKQAVDYIGAHAKV